MGGKQPFGKFDHVIEQVARNRQPGVATGPHSGKGVGRA